MNQQGKDAFLNKASVALAQTIARIGASLKKTRKQNQHIRTELPKVNEDDKIVQQKMLEHGVQRERELEVLEPAPYFFHCHVDFDNTQNEDLYFGKFSFTEENIYSWVTPVSSMRFEKPGKISYQTQDGKKRTGILKKKDQYMISQGKIVFLATESLEQGRELVYQSYFSNQKKDFALPEIVAQMEKAQDTVIRANHRGPLLISGPAGSGKTTLALHRVAYLCQSPDVSDQFHPNAIIVFVQDSGTQEYFSQLLPQLGIKGVTITTFATWAMNVLGISGYTYQFRVGKTPAQKDIYEFKKREAMKQLPNSVFEKNIYHTLANIYHHVFSEEEQTVWQQQKEQKVLDRFDLTILILLYKKQHGTLTLMQEYYQMSKKGAAKKKIGRFPITYSLMIFDEFQNYLPEQIQLAKSTLDETNNAVMYVGDMAQQTQIGTIQHWQEAKEQISTDRKVILQKVYRNTKNILEYINSLGYIIDIANNLREGEAVKEKICTTIQEEIAYVQEVANTCTGSLGVLAKEKEYLNAFFHINKKTNKNIRLMSMHEAQGVEFDTVCIVGISEHMFYLPYEKQSYREEKQRIHKDLLYVALTRAMNSLHVLGSVPLHTVIQKEQDKK